MAVLPAGQTPRGPVSLPLELPTAAGATRQALGAGNTGHPLCQLQKLGAKPCGCPGSKEPASARLTPAPGGPRGRPFPPSPRAPGGSWGGPFPPHPSFSFEGSMWT